MQQKRKSYILLNVALIRPLLIVLLVFYHAFAPYSGAWVPIDGFHEVKAYWWLDKLSYAFMLEMFVFISGYVFGYQVRTKGKSKLLAKKLFHGKFKRLIVPSMIFSLLYIILFQNICQPVTSTIYDVINGVGHMWFLPMLFWCFVGVWLVEKISINNFVVLIGLLILALVPLVGLPLRLTETTYYLFFFYAGYLIQRDGMSLNKLECPKATLAFVLMFVVLFPSLTMLRENATALTGG